MSSAVVSTSAAQGRPFFFDDEAEPEGSCGDSRPRLLALSGVEGSGRAQLDRRSLENHPQSQIPSKILPSSVTPASRLQVRPAPEMVPSGIPAIDALTGGLPRGCLTEICGPASSGRTTFLLAALAAATRRGEFCAAIDASDALDPHSAASAGVALDRLLWVRCGEDSQQKNNSPQRHGVTEKDGCPILAASFAARVGYSSQATFDFDRTELRKTGMKETGLRQDVSHQSERRLEQVLRATDLLLESGGFGLIVLDLADLPPQAARRIPLTTWFRFRRAIEHTPTILLAIEPQPIAGSCSSLLLQLASVGNQLHVLDGSLAIKLNPDTPIEANHGGPAAKRRKNAAHGASRGLDTGDSEAPEGQKKICSTGQTKSDFPCPTHAHLLTELVINAELIRSRLERKPACSVTFATKTAWAG